MILLNQTLKITQNICLVVTLFQIPSASAQEWFSTFEERNGFSEFSPPGFISGYGHDHDHSYRKHKRHKKHWRSGSSLNELNKLYYSKPYEEEFYNTRDHVDRSGSYTRYSNKKPAYSSHANRNPWKPVKSRYGKQSFSSNRPWGKLPEKKAVKRSNMRFHDQRFKHWVSQRDKTYLPPSMMTDSYLNNGFNPLYVPAGYAYSNAIQNHAFLNPLLLNSTSYQNYQSPGGFVPFTANNPGYYFLANNYYPYSGVNNRFWGW